MNTVLKAIYDLGWRYPILLPLQPFVFVLGVAVNLHRVLPERRSHRRQPRVQSQPFVILDGELQSADGLLKRAS